MTLSFVHENAAVIEIVNRALEKNVTITTNHAESSEHLRNVALWVAENYNGQNNFVLDVQRKVLAGRAMTAAQAAWVLNNLVIEQRGARATQAATAPKSTIAGLKLDQKIENGRYTVVSGDGFEFTFQIADTPEEWDRPIATRIISVLSGPDNTRNYTMVAWYNEDRGVAILTKASRLHSNPAMRECLQLLFSFERDAMIAAGELYAARSNRCWRCFRELTRAESQVRGLGPICAEKLGIAVENTPKKRTSKREKAFVAQVHETAARLLPLSGDASADMAELF